MPYRSGPVLVVDDFATTARIMRSILNQLGFSDVDTCPSGEAALAQVKLRKYGLILCDYEMGGMNGAEFAGRARSAPYDVTCPIILATASRESAAQCVRDGVQDFVDAFIFKPFKASELQVKLVEIGERMRSRQALLEREPVISPRQDKTDSG